MAKVLKYSSISFLFNFSVSVSYRKYYADILLSKLLQRCLKLIPFFMSQLREQWRTSDQNGGTDATNNNNKKSD